MGKNRPWNVQTIEAKGPSVSPTTNTTDTGMISQLMTYTCSGDANIMAMTMRWSTLRAPKSLVRHVGSENDAVIKVEHSFRLSWSCFLCHRWYACLFFYLWKEIFGLAPWPRCLVALYYKMVKPKPSQIHTRVVDCWPALRGQFQPGPRLAHRLASVRTKWNCTWKLQLKRLNCG